MIYESRLAHEGSSARTVRQPPVVEGERGATEWGSDFVYTVWTYTHSVSGISLAVSCELTQQALKSYLLGPAYQIGRESLIIDLDRWSDGQRQSKTIIDGLKLAKGSPTLQAGAHH